MHHVATRHSSRMWTTWYLLFNPACIHVPQVHSGNQLCVEFAWRKAIGQFRVIYSNSYVPPRVRGIKEKKSRWDSGMNNWFPPFYLIIRSWTIRPRPHVLWYFWIRTFFFPDTASVHTYPVNPAYESAPFWIRSSLERGNFWISYESGIVWTLNLSIFYPVT